MQSIQQSFTHDIGMRAGLERLHGDKVDAVFQGWYQGWTKPEYHDWNIHPLLNRITCPTLVVQGVDDEYALPKHAEDIANAIPGAGLWLEPGAGHMLPQEMPEEFNRKVIAFLTHDFFPCDYPDADVIIMVHRAGFKIRELPMVMFERDNGTSMHSGLRPVYYVFKMFLSILMTMLRKRPMPLY